MVDSSIEMHLIMFTKCVWLKQFCVFQQHSIFLMFLRYFLVGRSTLQITTFLRVFVLNMLKQSSRDRVPICESVGRLISEHPHPSSKIYFYSSGNMEPFHLHFLSSFLYISYSPNLLAMPRETSERLVRGFNLVLKNVQRKKVRLKFQACSV